MRKTKMSESDRAVPPMNVLTNRKRHFIEGDGSDEKLLSFADSQVPAWFTFPNHHKRKMRDSLVRFQSVAFRVANITIARVRLQVPVQRTIP